MEFIPHYSGSTGNLYQVRGDAGNILIEAGVAIKRIRKALGFRLSAVDGALITHCHGDHAQAVKDLMRAGVDCYMTRETAQAIGASGHRLLIIEPLKQFQVAGWTVLPFETQHCEGSIGFLIANGKNKLLFLTDTFYCRYRFRGLTHIALEVNWSRETLSADLDPVVRRRLYSSHMSLENAVKLLKANDLTAVRQIWLIHLSGTNADPDFFRRTIARATGKPVKAVF